MTQPVYFGGTPTSSTGYSSSGKQRPPARGAGADVRPPAAGGSSPARESGSTSTSTGDGGASTTNRRVVVYPNWNYQVSTSDFYSDRNPADPANAMWNVGITKEDAVAMWGSDDFTPELRRYLDDVAKSQHPLKKGKTLWQEAVDTAYALKDRGENVTPWSIISQQYLGRGSTAPADTPASDPSYSPSGGGGGGGYSGGGGGGGQVSLTNPSSARGLLLQTMQNVLGRNPTDREYKDFLKTLTETEMANPNTVSVEGDVVVQSGGTDPGMVALEFAQAAEDYKATQANKFYNAFMGALGGGVSG